MIGAIAAGALPILGSAIGSMADDGDEDSAKGARAAALAALSGVNLPSIEEQRIYLEKLVQQGELVPEALEVFNQDTSEMANISTDPRLKEAQMTALAKLAKQGEEGLTATDRAALLQVRNDVERDAQGRSEAILQGMAQRGMSGSGAELAAQLANSQAATERAQQQGLNTAALATQRALEATMNSGQLGGQIRSQDFNEQEAKARAQDVINQFNTANRQSVAASNVGSRNQAKEKNLSEKQRIADQNVGLSNQQEIHNKGLYQQRFENEMAKAGKIAGQQNLIGNAYDRSAEQTRAMWAGIGQGAGQAAGGISAYKNPGAAQTPMQAGPSHTMSAYAHGGVVEGEAKVKEDSVVNDTVPAMLSPGEIVVPRSVANASDEVILDFIKCLKKAKERE